MSTIGARSLLTVGCLLYLVGGCVTEKKTESFVPSLTADAKSSPKPAASTAIPNLDPGAIRLQDISGALLLFFAEHRYLPETLDQLKTLAELDEPLNFISPASGKPYIYTSNGMVLQDQKKRLIVYDPAPGPQGYREAIVIDEPVVGQPLTAKVVAVPESFFLLHPPK